MPSNCLRLEAGYLTKQVIVGIFEEVPVSGAAHARRVRDVGLPRTPGALNFRSRKSAAAASCLASTGCLTGRRQRSRRSPGLGLGCHTAAGSVELRLPRRDDVSQVERRSQFAEDGVLDELQRFAAVGGLGQ